MFDFVPVLADGPHNSPEEGACVMEMVSFLAGEEWSDTPACSNDLISFLAQNVNDILDDKSRQLILGQFDRLFNTSDPRFVKEFKAEYLKYMATKVDGFCTTVAAYATRNDRLQAERDLSLAAELDDVYGENYARMAGSSVIRMTYYYGNTVDGTVNPSPEGVIQILADVLDIYDRVSGRNEVPVQDLNKLKEMVPSV